MVSEEKDTLDRPLVRVEQTDGITICRVYTFQGLMFYLEGIQEEMVDEEWMSIVKGKKKYDTGIIYLLSVTTLYVLSMFSLPFKLCS